MFSFWPLPSVPEGCVTSLRPVATFFPLLSPLPPKFGMCLWSECLFYQLLSPWEHGTSCHGGFLSMEALTCDCREIVTSVITVSKWVCFPWNKWWGLWIYGKLSVCDIWLKLGFSSQHLDFIFFSSYRCFWYISDSNLVWVNTDPNNNSNNSWFFSVLVIKNLRVWI